MENRMSTPRFVERVSKERNCSPELVRTIVTDCLAALHESAVKQGIGEALVGAWFELGDLAAYHFGGVLAEAGKHESGELLETYKRLDPSMERFRTIVDQWEHEAERAREAER
jgi:hypothetical protein